MTQANGGSSDKVEDFLEALGSDLTSAYAGLLERRRQRARVRRIAVIISAAALCLTAAAAASVRLLGWPAPGHVRADIAAVDQGMPSDLQLRPDVEHARAVAQNGTSTLYVADLSGGGHCYEIVTTGDRGRGATCHTASELPGQPIELTLPSDDNVADDAPVIVGGHVNPKGTARLTIAYGQGGATNEIPLGDDRYFVFEVPADHRAQARSSELIFSALTADSHVLARTTIPSDWAGPARPDTDQPIFVNTRSDANDLTKVYEISGHVSVAGASDLELRYRDGARIQISLRPNDEYSYVVPSDRIDDFMIPLMLSARDAQGRVLATTYVAAVAYWHGRTR
jgi:hypothetical protein